MANFPSSAVIFPGVYGPTDDTTFLFHNNSFIEIHRDKLMLGGYLGGNVKDVAFALAQEVLRYGDGSIATTWNDILRAQHGKGCYKLEYLRNEKPPKFFDELNRQFTKICKMKAFW